VKNNGSVESLGPRPADPGATHPPLTATRALILDVLERQSDLVTLAELSRATALHVNTLRDHLTVLESHGRVRRHRASPSGRGRPATLYEAVPASGATTEYAALASALAKSIDQRSDNPRAEGMDAGRQWGHALAKGMPVTAPLRPADARRAVVRLLGGLGFAPEQLPRSSAVRLKRCPLLEAATIHPAVVCGVHQGLIEGALQEWGAPAQQAELLPFSEPGACRLLMPAPR
jgi:predicted ArsR family transcriptional regulator